MKTITQSLAVVVTSLVTVIGSTAVAAPAPRIAGKDVVTHQQVVVTGDSKKALVVVFLSAVCPCSDSHIQELKALAKEHPEVEFVGVHSNSDEEPEPTKIYFEEAKLPFPVIQDVNTKIADQYKALKTPHVFVAKANGDMLYQGGVSSSQKFEKADKKLLREALEDIQQNRAIRTPEGRTLGCVISRGERNVW